MRGKFKKSTVLNVDGEKIAVVGYTTKDTPALSNTGELIFKDEVQSIKEEIAAIKTTDPSINKFIALGHAGFNMDKKIAREVEDVDIVVGGHSNTFLYTGGPPSIERPEGPYPFVVTKPNGKKALCVQDYAYGKYLGFLKVSFDDNGDLKRWTGNPILLDKTVKQDRKVLAEMEPFKAEVNIFKKRKVGETRAFLEGDSKVCRRQECNLGNAITDGMLRYNLNNRNNNTWNSVSIVIMNSGGIRSPIEQSGSIEQRKIAFEDVLTVLPFRNTVSLMDFTGSLLLEVLEHSVATLTTEPSDDLKGQFLQISGLRVKYNLYKPVGKRVVDVQVLCTECLVPKFEKLDKDKNYRVILPDFIANGGDGYKMIKEKGENYVDKGDLDSAVFNDYLKEYSPIIQGLDGRIEFTRQTVRSDTMNFSNDFQYYC